MRTQQPGIVESDLPGDLSDRQGGLLQQVPRPADAFGQKPGSRRHSGGVAHVAVDAADAQARLAGNARERPLFVKTAPDAVQKRRQPRSRPAWHRPADELELPAIPVRRHDESPGNLVRNAGAEVAADDVKAKVKPGGAARRRQHGALVNIQNVGHQSHVGEARRQLLGVMPMRRCPLSRQQAGRGQNEGPGADRHQPASARMCGAQRGDERRRDGRIRPAPAGNDGHEGIIEQLKAAVGAHFDATGSTQRPGFGRGDLEAIPAGACLRPGEAEDFEGAAIFERAKPVKGEKDDEGCGQDWHDPHDNGRSGRFATTGALARVGRDGRCRRIRGQEMEELMMRLIGLLDSPYGRRVAISLDMMGLPFRHERLSVFRNYDAFSAINPVVKAPTLVTDDGTVLMDSSLILDHVERLAPPERRLSPADLKAHARCQHIIGLALAACEKSVQLVYEQNLRPPEKQHRPWIDRVEQQLRAACRLLEDGMPADGRWLVDDQPRQADVTVAVTWTFTQRALDAIILPGVHPRLSQFAAHAERLPAFMTYPYE